MKRVLFVISMLMLFSVTCWAQMGNTASLSPSVAGTAHPSPYNFPGRQFPRIEADNKVTFQFTAPDAAKVQVSIADKARDMTKGENGVWTYTTPEPQDLGYHNYWMVVDGAVVVDPYTNAFIGYSHMCNGFEVPDPNGGFYEMKQDVPHGNVLIKNYYAKSINQWRQIYVYTPPQYDKDITTRYPVLYLQHGGGEDQRVWIEMGRTNLILDNLLAENKCKPFIVVMETSAVGGAGGMMGGRGAGMMGGGRGGRGAATPAAPGVPGAAMAPAAGADAGRGAGRGMGGGQGGPAGGAYGQLMVNDLIPWVDANFRTLADQPNRAMAGLSMGSMQTRTVTLAFPDKFAYIGLFSGSTISMSDVENTEGFKDKFKLVFMSFGSKEPSVSRIKPAADALNEAGINAVSYVSPLTAHEFQSWRRSLREFSMLLFKD